MSPENSPVVLDGYVKYEEAEVDILAILRNYRHNEIKRLKMVTFRPFRIYVLLHITVLAREAHSKGVVTHSVTHPELFLHTLSAQS